MKRPQEWTQSGRHLEDRGEGLTLFEKLVGVAVTLFAAVVWLIALGI